MLSQALSRWKGSRRLWCSVIRARHFISTATSALKAESSCIGRRTTKVSTTEATSNCVDACGKCQTHFCGCNGPHYRLDSQLTESTHYTTIYSLDCIIHHGTVVWGATFERFGSGLSVWVVLILLKHTSNLKYYRGTAWLFYNILQYHISHPSAVFPRSSTYTLRAHTALGAQLLHGQTALAP